MFCPECRTEYRPGFTKCADCGVDLVSRLPEDAPAADADVPTNSEGLELLWTGVSQAVSDRIDNALDAAHIFHKNTDKGVGLLANFVRAVQFVWIDPRDRSAARAIVDNVLANSGDEPLPENEQLAIDSAEVNPFGFGRRVYNRASDPAGAELEAQLPEPEATDEPVPNDTADDPDPDDATSEVWAGEDKEMAQYLKDCLDGVGIGTILGQAGGKTRVLVLPGSESRAREIVREVVEGAPPQ